MHFYIWYIHFIYTLYVYILFQEVEVEVGELFWNYFCFTAEIEGHMYFALKKVDSTEENM